MSHKRKPVPPNPPRWQPAEDPTSIDVPGLDTTAPVNDQVDQIEQLITFKLQNIDENFSKIQNLLATKLLPAVKRYAVGTEPVREAAKFWTSFYEEAAQIRIPAFDDYSSVHEQTRSDNDSTDTTQPDTTHSHPSHPCEPSVAGSSESSFGHVAYSSTPATGSRRRSVSSDDTFAIRGSVEAPMWEGSMESPLVRLDREVRDLTKTEETQRQNVSASMAPPPSLEVTQLETSGARKGEQQGNDPDASLLRNVLLQTLRAAPVKPSTQHVSPLKLKTKGRTPGRVNRRRTPRHRETADESFDGLPEDMSPPRMMSPAAPPRSSAELGLLKLGQSPIKDAAERIKRDLINDAERTRSRGGLFDKSGSGWMRGGTESSMSTVPTPPSLSRYTRQGRYAVDSSNSMLDPSLESMLQRVGLKEPSQSGFEIESRSVSDAIEDISLRTPLPDSDFSDSDSLDEIHNTAHPSTAFLLASQQARRHSSNSDDSFDSSNNSDDSLSQEPVHPFAREAGQDDFDDDSFDNDGYEGREGEEETVFGLPHTHRQLQVHRESELRLMGDHLLENTLGIGDHIARSGIPVEESPTPWVRNGRV